MPLRSRTLLEDDCSSQTGQRVILHSSPPSARPVRPRARFRWLANSIASHSDRSQTAFTRHGLRRMGASYTTHGTAGAGRAISARPNVSQYCTRSVPRHVDRTAHGSFFARQLICTPGSVPVSTVFSRPGVGALDRRGILCVIGWLLLRLAFDLPELGGLAMDGIQAIETLNSFRRILVEGKPQQISLMLADIEERLKGEGFTREPIAEKRLNWNPARRNTFLCFLGGPQGGPKLLLCLNRVSDRKVRGATCSFIEGPDASPVQVAEVVDSVINKIIVPSSNHFGLKVTQPRFGPLSVVPPTTMTALVTFTDIRSPVENRLVVETCRHDGCVLRNGTVGIVQIQSIFPKCGRSKVP